MSRKKKWFGYILYCLIITTGFLYLRFPSDVIKGYVRDAVNKPNIPIVLSIDRVKPWPTLGLKVEEAEISLKDASAPQLFKAESLIVRPEIWSFVKGSRRYRFQCQAYGGSIKGCVQFRQNAMKLPFHTEIEVKDMQVGGHEYLEDLVGRRIQGNLSGTIHYSGQSNNLMSGDGGANLRLFDGAIELLLPLLGLDSIAFNEIEIDMVLKKRMINIDRFDLTGDQLKGKLSGKVSLKKQIERSSLDLRGELEPFAAFFTSAEGTSSAMNIIKKRLKRGALDFVIRGTLREPKVRFI
jgi:type II secretion system protein N